MDVDGVGRDIGDQKPLKQLTLQQNYAGVFQDLKTARAQEEAMKMRLQMLEDISNKKHADFRRSPTAENKQADEKAAIDVLRADKDFREARRVLEWSQIAADGVKADLARQFGS
ncbi:hypothetical protein B0T21DRAFT_63231 [Apiosordaria backusii]|uniref:Uncharacterized protein n=1 Tax=Apiosordaria backusii TaxID=314023 RepID=A0AA40AIJ8_9PEZI|nr:hypothetical protein B0T21DRAFT_63231 [Apiosordaria backusii]